MKKTVLILALTATSFSFATPTPWLIRARAIDVMPAASSSKLAVIGGSVKQISNQVVPELDISYFFTPSIAAELILATSQHSPTATGTSLGHVALGSVRALPPTLTAQYHFRPDCSFNPYVGAGINYTYFYDIHKGPVATNISYSNTFGPALQVGADMPLDQHWLVNMDVKKVYMDPKVGVSTAVGHMSPRVHIDPWIVGLGVGYRF